MSVIYKPLFEVKLLHEYYVTRNDGSSVFEKVSQQERLDFLAAEYALGTESINNDIHFEFPDFLKPAYESHFLKIIPTYSGFKVVTKVNRQILNDQTLVYIPFASLPEDLNIYILFLRTTSIIDSFTNSRIQRPFPSTYLFSNDDLPGNRVFPFLTNPVPAFNAGFTYEQGELSEGASGIQGYYNDGNSDKMYEVTGAGFANEADRILLPGKFRYTFPDSAGLTSASFTLKDKDGNVLKSYIETNTTGIFRDTLLNFSSFSNPDTPFTLEVTGNNGYAATHILYLSDELLITNPWAVLSIKSNATNTDFNLLASDGNLIMRRDPVGNWTNAPIFEIPVKSRFVFWRFMNNKGNELDINPSLTDYVNKENNVLITKRPVAMTRSFFLLRKEGSNDTVYVPNPDTDEIKIESARRICLNIRVPESELFPVSP